MIKIRTVNDNDCGQILDIYSQYINTPVTFEYKLPTHEEFAERINEINSFYPYLVLEEKNNVIGYAYAHKLRERQAYQWVAELSIYFDKNKTSKGYGEILYKKLLQCLELQGIKTVYGCVTMPNEKSEKLHLGLNFQNVGTFKKAGYKNGEWLDITWFEKNIAPCETNPENVISIHEVNRYELNKILSL